MVAVRPTGPKPGAGRPPPSRLPAAAPLARRPRGAACWGVTTPPGSWRAALAALCLVPLLARAQGASINGVVRDSLARLPLGGAIVQLVAADSLSRFGHTTTADSLGRFVISGVPDGRYLLGFHHPMLDSLGVASPLRELYVVGARPVRADLATPSAARMREAICGTRPPRDSSGVVAGVVRSATDGAPVAGATVAAEWLEYTFAVSGISRRAPRLVAVTGENGWFAVCSVPAGGTISLVASRGPDSTDRFELQVPVEGFARRELHLGPARTVALVDTTRPPGARRARTGTGRLGGTVVTAVRGQPLAGALVGIADGPETRASASGEWSLADLPLGTRLLEVRALGYYPERRAVDVTAASAPVRVALSTLRAVLDTVRVTASRLDRSMAGFQQRSRTGPGRYLTAADISARHPLVASHLFRMIPGLRLQTEGADSRLLMRGPFGECTPSFVLNGQPIEHLTAADIDDWVTPSEIAGIEVHDAATVPPQFQAPLRGCGAVVVWTKQR